MRRNTDVLPSEPMESINIYTLGNFAVALSDILAPALIVAALTRPLVRWPLLNAVAGVVGSYAVQRLDIDDYEHSSWPYIFTGVLVFLFFEWRERAGLDALAPFKRWRDRRKGARAGDA